MSLKNKLFDFGALGFIFAAMIILILNPEKMATGIADGLMVCGNILIPSLFPFTVLAVFLIESGAVQKHLKSSLLYSTFVFLVSIIGGYPVGAKIISASHDKGILKSADAENLLNVCVNAGPAFVITAVGKTLFGDIRIGILLFISHILASGTLFVFNIDKFRKFNYVFREEKTARLSESFVKSVSDACIALINICSYVLLFSGIIKFIDNEIIIGFLEVTNGVLVNKNIYFVSFLLGFSGICIIMQIISIGKNFIKRPINLIINRILHGSFSVIYLKVLLLIFPLKLQTISNNVDFNFRQVTENTVGGIFLIFLAVMFIYSLDSKRYSGKLNKDIW